MKKTIREQISIFTFSISIYLLNILQGSQINFNFDSCITNKFEEGIFILTIVLTPLLLILKKQKIIKKIILPIFLATLITIWIEPYISSYQYELTNKNLEETCNSIQEFKAKNGRLPTTLKEIKESRYSKTGFKIFNGRFEYQKQDNQNFTIFYTGKYEYNCAAENCSTYGYNSLFTCNKCVFVNNEQLNQKK